MGGWWWQQSNGWLMHPDRWLGQPGILVPLVIWELLWTGIGTWRAARNKQLYWFIAMLVINSVGILEIVYLLFFRKDKDRAGKKK